MHIVKQILITLVVLLVGGALWLRFDSRAGDYLASLDLPGPVTSVVALLTPEPAGKVAAPTGLDSRAGSGRNPGGRSGAGRPTIVVADQVGTSMTRNRMRAIGTGEAQRSVTVYPDVTGIIRTVPFKSGDAVAVGDVLANLEDENEQVAVERAKIAIDASEAKIERVNRLQASRAITAVEVTDAIRELDNAKLDLRAAEVALAKRRIVAPIAGRVGIVSVDTGDLVNNQTIITTIDDRSEIKVIFYTPESFVQDLQIGATIEAVSTARPEKVHTGVITAIDSRLDEASRTLRTEATIANQQDELRPGMSFAMTLELDGQRLLSVDPLSVQWERSGPIVWTITGDTVAKTPVRIIERNIDRVLVASEQLKEGDTVVVEGIQALREGGKVEIQNNQGPPTEPLAKGPALGPSAQAQFPRPPVAGEAGISIASPADAAVRRSSTTTGSVQ
ncbi:MexH family multidrug efflux RND transporter periplasmic adaptor subunit [Aureimonas sp. SA4125]|uniref:efflux RND transporter periplasmic adaptor subunit n=1 Tax=Aureimonas sp. SA4125 TaxID=2826993 RepID=UPI001CC65FEB|nr:efflux RND transporter periplasmic adaptor subunit [Aureimonas sp. SA4125]BDA85894.1 MexH family multidrug efflux RND transporter periplasmic adaptor subunit [Aureimonas sp. SA4125]